MPATTEKKRIFRMKCRHVKDMVHHINACSPVPKEL